MESRRARSVVVVVVLFVALPSLLLTALGAMAVANEEEAARRRLETIYFPVVLDLARRFNELAEALETEAEAPLTQLVAWSRAGASAEPPPELAEFFGTTEFALNYFVIDDGGERLSSPGSSGLAPSLIEATHAPAYRVGDPEGCEPFARESQRGCAAGLAHVLCLCGAGGEARGRQLLAQQVARCPEFEQALVEDSIAALVAAPRGGARATERFLELANGLADRLAEPRRGPQSVAAEVSSRMVAGRLMSQPEQKPQHAWHRLQAVAERRALIAHLSGFGRSTDKPPALSAVRAGEWRRLVLTRIDGGVLSGFEVVPTGFYEFLNGALSQHERAAGTHAAMVPTEPPCCWQDAVKERMGVDHDELVAAWVLLKKTDLAWEVVLFLDDPSMVGTLGRNRFWLYFWSLVLIVGVLLWGIIRTVVMVVREARLARLKTDFVSSVSHDLRTPLTSIRMFTETLLLGRVESREEERECLQIIAQETERLTRLTERILDFSRMEAGRKAYCFAAEGVRALVEQALAACRPVIEEARVQLQVDLAEDLPPIVADRDAMVEVLINLISNAVKYSTGDRRVTVRARAIGSRVALSLTDNGIGIPKGERRRVFDKFYRVDCRRTSEVGGSGLGLSLVKYIVDAHRGEISVDSAPGGGSVFTLLLPASGLPVASESQDTAPSLV